MSNLKKYKMSKSLTKGFVYLLVAGDELYKIGTTKKPLKERIAQLQTGNPFPIKVIKSYVSPQYKRIEKYLHNVFKSYRSRNNGEWFHLKEHHIFQFEEYCKKAETAIEYLLDVNPFFK